MSVLNTVFLYPAFRQNATYNMQIYNPTQKYIDLNIVKTTDVTFLIYIDCSLVVGCQRVHLHLCTAPSPGSQWPHLKGIL